MEIISKTKHTDQTFIDALNNLLEINNDRIDGYDHASKETDESDLKTLFGKFKQTSMKCKKELAVEVEKLGGKPIEGTRTTGKLYRAWMDIKAAITNKNRKAILSSCEFGEDVAVKNYELTLRDIFPSNFSAYHQLISKQYDMIKAEHDKVKHMRDIAG